MTGIAVPLAAWADFQLAALSADSGAKLASGAEILSQRARLNGFRVPGLVSAGGGCRFYETRDGHIALNLSRPDDRALLPALLQDANASEANVEGHVAIHATTELLSRGRELGLAIAAIDERPASPSCAETMCGSPVASRKSQPLVIDLSALWAGPLASHLLMLAGATVVKVESPSRQDAMREGDPALFAHLNAGKEQRALDLRNEAGRAALLTLIEQADVVIEAARPRALLQLGFDADALVRERPGLVWVTITGHGIAGDSANWVAFGDDAAVAGGLSAALRDASGQIGFVGDAIADPLSGIHAARIAWDAFARGRGSRHILSMSGIIAEAIEWERGRDAAAFDASLQNWAAAVGEDWPGC